MTPPARLAAAAAILDFIAAGEPAEKVLTTWARRNRFAGSKDRAAIRDLVYEILRRRRSCAARGGGASGRALCLGLVRIRGDVPEAYFTADRYALSPLSSKEAESGRMPVGPEALDIPDWIAPQLRDSLGSEFEEVCQFMQGRAPLDLRVNVARTDRDHAQEKLQEEGIESDPVNIAETALRVTGGARSVHLTEAYRTGLVEIQDAGAQAICAIVAVEAGTRVLDFCAGGGGKALAFAARGAEVVAHDADPARMADLPARAARAGAAIQCVGAGVLSSLERFDVVVADVPCSGSGAWRRQVEAKWRLTPERLHELLDLQWEIAKEAAQHVNPGGVFAYVTCSLLKAENEAQAERFAREAGPDWMALSQRRISPLDGADGFFLALFRKLT